MTDLSRLQDRHHSLHVALGDNRDHADAHVEDLIHLRQIDISILLQDFENVRHTPTLRFNDGIAVFWQDARQIVDQTAAGDMGETFDHTARNFREERLVIFMYAQKFFADYTCRSRRGTSPSDWRTWQARADFKSHLLEQNFARKRIAIRVQ